MRDCNKYDCAHRRKLEECNSCSHNFRVRDKYVPKKEGCIDYVEGWCHGMGEFCKYEKHGMCFRWS